MVRFASQLTRLRPALGGLLDRRARALRVLLESDPGDEHDAGDKPDPSADGDPDAAGAGEGRGRRRVARAELRLARPSTEPLARLGPDPDPLQGFAAAFARLRPDLGDAALV